MADKRKQNHNTNHLWTNGVNLNLFEEVVGLHEKTINTKNLLLVFSCAHSFGKFPGKIIQEMKKEAKKPVDVKLLT